MFELVEIPYHHVHHGFFQFFNHPQPITKPCQQTLKPSPCVTDVALQLLHDERCSDGGTTHMKQTSHSQLQRDNLLAMKMVL